MHYNEDTLVARKSLWDAGIKQENPIVFVSLDGIKWRVREAHDVETKKKTRLTVQPFTSPALDTSTNPRITTLRLPRQGALCVRGFQFTTAPPDTQHEHRDRERDVVPTLQSACPALAVPLALAAARKQRRLRSRLMRARARTTATQRNEAVAQCLMRVATSVYLLLRKSVNG